MFIACDGGGCCGEKIRSKASRTNTINTYIVGNKGDFGLAKFLLPD
jgi:hypothetical protein